MVTTAKEAIQLLQETYKNNLDEDLVITWWDSSDFEGLDLDEAFNVCDEALEVCIGHVNETVYDSTDSDEDEDEEEEEE
jgi:hypothetical protein